LESREKTALTGDQANPFGPATKPGNGLDDASQERVQLVFKTAS
jgi:hypothetical protein